ncbi:hypothetical protein AB0M68_30210 [Streptomyces sp. NPDC051453]|uniref:hypothetical protein n=1 Tax=Streptomyces sp. NPDC051453 TaxID=3154941 RepID=UPI003428016E
MSAELIGAMRDEDEERLLTLLAADMQDAVTQLTGEAAHAEAVTRLRAAPHRVRARTAPGYPPPGAVRVLGEREEGRAHAWLLVGNP